MPKATDNRRATEPANDPTSGDADDIEENVEGVTEADDLDPDEAAAPDELSEETGIDLTDASELDADNVPADEEFDRVQQIPD